MRLSQFKANGDEQPWVGVVTSENSVINIAEAADETGSDLPRQMRDILSEPNWKAEVETVVETGREHGLAHYNQSEVKQVAPISQPEKIVGVGLNYHDHAEETGMEVPDTPILFSKFPTSVTDPGSTITWDTDLTDSVDYETELVAVVGKRGRNFDPSDASEYIAGYTVGNDVSARDLQFKDDQWVRGKSLDTFAPIGPEILTADEIDDPHDLDLWTDLNGERVQDSNTSKMIFDVYELVSFCSQSFTLTPGDLIFTGTPFGAGYFHSPKVLLEDGDTVTVGIEDIGELTNQCKTI